MNDHLTYDLAYWIGERYSIKLRKEQGLPKPWTSDATLQNVRFCNVHREDDKVTQWIRKNWNKAGDPAWKFVLGRMINWPDTLKELMPLATLWQPAAIKEVMKELRSNGDKIFTSAYTISTCGKSMDKVDYVVDWVCQKVADKQDSFSYGTLASAHSQLTEIDGLGSFLSGQVIADMKNTLGHTLNRAQDWWTWSTPGPGSLRGLGWYFNKDPGSVYTRQYHQKLLVCREEVDPLIPDYVPRISDQDFQNCLCEFSKWCKFTYLHGHIRNGYNGVR